MKTQFKDFSENLWTTIFNQVQSAIQAPAPHYAVFDADGTLWDNDAGNSFFNYEIENKLIPLPQDPWRHVYALKEIDTLRAFLWLAQIHKGVPIQKVRTWAKEALQKSGPIVFFPAIKKLISYLQKNNVEIFVVTASVQWAVEPCVELLGIPPKNVVGVKTKIENGIITDIQDGFVTYQENKLKALLERTHGKKPLLACGNTMGDFWLLDSATHVKLAVRTESDELHFKDQNIKKQEEHLYQEACERGWLTHNFL